MEHNLGLLANIELRYRAVCGYFGRPDGHRANARRRDQFAERHW